MNICAARDQGPSSAGMARHLAPFSWRQRMAEMVRRRSFGCVLPLGRHASTNGSKFVHCASDTIALSSFQKEQNARHHKQFKREQALGISSVVDWRCSIVSSSSGFSLLASMSQCTANFILHFCNFAGCKVLQTRSDAAWYSQ